MSSKPDHSWLNFIIGDLDSLETQLRAFTDSADRELRPFTPEETYAIRSLAIRIHSQVYLLNLTMKELNAKKPSFWKKLFRK